MLQQLQITNYAIIESLEIKFSDGLNVVTGETGAGKSIILGALSLILGDRADNSALVNREKKCIIEGMFEYMPTPLIANFFSRNDLDILPEITVRREISPAGKSRSFINDTPVTLAQLQQLSSLLVDLHQQFDTLDLNSAGFQLNVLDALANNQQLLDEYTISYQQWQTLKNKLSNLQKQQEEFNKEYDYLQFQYAELAEAAFKENELENIDRELKLLVNAEGIKNALQQSVYLLEEKEEPLLQQLKNIVHLLQAYTDYHKNLPAIIDRLSSAQIELQDISGELLAIGQNIHYDAATIEELNDRLSLGYKLQKKHGVQTTAELLEIQQSLENKLQGSIHVQEQTQTLEKEIDELSVKVKQIATELSQKRKKQINGLEKKVNALLAQVGMPNATLKVNITEKNISKDGLDDVEFLFDPNKSNQFKPVSKIASGGELSRLMLCIKSLVAEKMNMPTLIFDEIDTGISGEAAKQVGIIMKQLSISRQVICITHQPQIAGKADIHFYVYKDAQESTIRTGIRTLSPEERITAIAQMLSGKNPTAAALENAKEMILSS